MIIKIELGQPRILGHSLGYGDDRQKLSLFYLGERWLVIHKKTSTDWGGVNAPPEIYPARYMIFKIVSIYNDPTIHEKSIKCYEVCDIEPAKKWHAVKKRLKPIIEDAESDPSVTEEGLTDLIDKLKNELNLEES